jgi:hypothetical protein
MNKNVRNALIVLVIAALVVLVPGGGTGATVAFTAVWLAFLTSMGWFASLMYREHRTALYSLGDSRRAVLYGAIAVATLTLTATKRLTTTSTGTIAWIALLVAAAYAAFAVIWAARQY